MKGLVTTLLLGSCLAASSCTGDASRATSALPDTVMETAASGVDPLARKKQRSDVEDFLDAYARDKVDAINAGQRAIATGTPQSYYLDTKEIREFGSNAKGHYNYIAVFRYCEVTRCQATSRSTEMIVVVPRKDGGHRVQQSLDLGVTGRINLGSDGVIEATSVEFAPDDPPCCPSAQVVRRYRLNSGALQQL